MTRTSFDLTILKSTLYDACCKMMNFLAQLDTNPPSYADWGDLFDQLDAVVAQHVVRPAPKPLVEAFIRAYEWLPEIASQLLTDPTHASARNQLIGLMNRIIFVLS